jgi:hypothetical protein
MGRRIRGSLTVISYRRAARRPLQQRARWLEAPLNVAEGQSPSADCIQRPAPRRRVKGASATHLTEPLCASAALTRPERFARLWLREVSASCSSRAPNRNSPMAGLPAGAVSELGSSDIEECLDAQCLVARGLQPLPP